MSSILHVLLVINAVRPVLVGNEWHVRYQHDTILDRKVAKCGEFSRKQMHARQMTIIAEGQIYVHEGCNLYLECAA